MALITLLDAQLAFGHVPLLDHADFSLETAERVGLIGRNGAGKSSLLKAIMGLMPRRTGSVAFAGQDISNAEPYEAAQLGLGYVPEDRDRKSVV